MINLSSYSNYSQLFKSVGQYSSASSTGGAYLPAAYLVGKYSKEINAAVSSQATGFFSGLQKSATDLSKTAKTLEKTSDRYTAESSSASGTLSSNNKYSDNTIQINQLATKQVNQSNALKATESTGLSEGSYGFSFIKDNKTYSFNVNITSKDTNQSALEKIAAGVNSLDAGITGKISKDALGNQQLTVESKDTGAKNQFSVSGTGADAIGLNQKIQDAANSDFTFNGKQYKTDSNSVTLDNGKTQLNLKKTTTGAEKLQLTQDTSVLQKNITEFVKSYNQFQETLSNGTDNKALQATSRRVTNVLSQFESDLKSIGIQTDDRGRLSVDTEKLTAALSNDPTAAKKLFTKTNSFTDKIQDIAQSTAKAPAAQWIAASQKTATYGELLKQSLSSQMFSSQSSGNFFDLSL